MTDTEPDLERRFAAGEDVLLIDRKRRRYLVTLKEGGEFHNHTGVLAHDSTARRRSRARRYRTSHGASILALRPTLNEIVLKMPRGAQVIYPKDLGPIVIHGRHPPRRPGARVRHRLGCDVHGHAPRRRVRSSATSSARTSPTERRRTSTGSRRTWRRTTGSSCVTATTASTRRTSTASSSTSPSRGGSFPTPRPSMRTGGIILAYTPTIGQAATLPPAARRVAVRLRRDARGAAAARGTSRASRSVPTTGWSPTPGSSPAPGSSPPRPDVRPPPGGRHEPARRRPLGFADPGCRRRLPPRVPDAHGVVDRHGPRPGRRRPIAALVPRPVLRRSPRRSLLAVRRGDPARRVVHRPGHRAARREPAADPSPERATGLSPTTSSAASPACSASPWPCGCCCPTMAALARASSPSRPGTRWSPGPSTDTFPDAPDTLVALRRLVGDDQFPQVFAALTPAPGHRVRRRPIRGSPPTSSLGSRRRR